jgi:hypothetical protein
MSKNRVRTGEASFQGGIYKQTEWDDSLQFQRYSWFQELNLLFDLLVAEVPAKSPFRQWFSSSEQTTINGCADFKVVMTYNLDSSRISETMLWSQAADAGYQRVSLSHFGPYLKLHPQYNNQSFHLYRVEGLCLPRKLSDSGVGFKLNFPNYRQVMVL